MTENNNNEFTFCEQEISSYEKTILCLALAYSCAPLIEPTDKLIDELSVFLKIDNTLLHQALTNKTDICMEFQRIKFGSDTTNCYEFFNNTFFDAIIRLYLSYKELENISDSDKSQDIRNTIDAIRIITHYFEVTNAKTATYECILNKEFSLKHTVFDSGSFPTNEYLKMLELILINDKRTQYYKKLLPLISLLSQYELLTRLNSLFLIVICQIIMHSPYFETEISEIAADMYDNLLFISKNAKIISININKLICNPSIKPDDRSRNNNTTRMQILYSYDNYDAYELRMDFPHKGQAFMHFNNISPGNTTCFLFNPNEYNSIISEYPDLKNCFISYGARWMLKERINCQLTPELSEQYDKLEKQKSHDPIFEKIYSEDSVNHFLNLLSFMLPENCTIPIDKDGIHAKNCFNSDVIIRNLTLLYLAILENDNDIESFIGDNIINKAYEYKLITHKPAVPISIDDLCLIAYESLSQANIL